MVLQVEWLTMKYNSYGWADPFIWTINVKTNIPLQDNGYDCGVFAVVFTEHCIFRHPINFTQADMMYYRQRIVIEIFKRSWELNAYRLGLIENAHRLGLDKIPIDSIKPED